ncbi:hypothetical protein HNP25_002233 [Arcicella rosea]|uniref:Uncharacterized protein n=1 Tax=Arcicella rosea TaxID=502909 RepID=A0A841EK59_9BACT|nr:hypothetical protein [Arcicella rosea]
MALGFSLSVKLPKSGKQPANGLFTCFNKATNQSGLVEMVI